MVEGNFIGTNAAGTTIVTNEGDGVIINGPGSTRNTIGGTTPAAHNLIAGNGEHGVEISASDANIVRGNVIGTDKTGIIDLGNEQDGVRMTSSSRNVVSNNVIAFNGDTTHNDNGVEVLKSDTASPVGNRILSNSIFQNQALGIDLSNSGTGGREQDAKDPDTGPNNLQNFPVISSATSTAGGTTIAGTLNSTPGTGGFRIDFYSSPSCDPSGNGEGQTYLGSTTVGTDDGGLANFNVSLPAPAAGCPARWAE